MPAGSGGPDPQGSGPHPDVRRLTSELWAWADDLNSLVIDRLDSGVAVMAAAAGDCIVLLAHGHTNDVPPAPLTQCWLLPVELLERVVGQLDHLRRRGEPDA